MRNLLVFVVRSILGFSSFRMSVLPSSILSVIRAEYDAGHVLKTWPGLEKFPPAWIIHEPEG
jgi:hypothetical protein